MLLAALDLGWQVEEPVFLRLRWGEGDHWVFHFILQQNPMSQPCLITTRYSPEIARLVLEEGWQVDRFPLTLKENLLDRAYGEDRSAHAHFQEVSDLLF